MHEPLSQLIRCFASVFPNLSVEQIQRAEIDSVKEWDSLATVTLVAVIEQEFGAQIDMFDLPEFVSFKAVQEYLEKHVFACEVERAAGESL